MTPMGVAVIGAGYWGPNLVRNFLACPSWDLRWVVRPRRRAGPQRRWAPYRRRRRSPPTSTEVLDDPRRRRRRDRHAGRHPHRRRRWPRSTPASTCWSRSRWRRRWPRVRSWSTRPSERGLVLMCDHTYCYTPAVLKIRELVHGGELGDLQYVDSVRINLGLVQPDIDVLWDLAPHDLSILDFILPTAATRSRWRRTAPTRSAPAAPASAYLTLPLRQRRDRPRPRQLAEPHQDPHDDHRRLQADAGVGRPQPGAAHQRLRPGRRAARRRPRATAAPAGAGRLPARATWSRPPSPSARRCRAWWPSSPPAIREGRPPLTDGRRRAAGPRAPRGRLAAASSRAAASSTSGGQR